MVKRNVGENGVGENNSRGRKKKEYLKRKNKSQAAKLRRGKYA